MFFFILLSIILFFFCLYFYFDNKKIKQRIIELELETKTILERKIINNKEDLVSIANISVETDKKPSAISKSPKTSNNESKLPEEPSIFEFARKGIPKYTATNNNHEYQVYQSQSPTTPILAKSTSQTTISAKPLNSKIEPSPQYKQVTKTNDNDTFNISNVSISSTFDPNEFIKKDTKITIQTNEKFKNIKSQDDNNKYLKELSQKISEELTPKTIELTDYEKIQEEQAVISYQELLSLKEKLKNQEHQDEQFLENLKELRQLLD